MKLPMIVNLGHQYTTISENLAYQFQLLGNSIGYKMTITKRPIPEFAYIGDRRIYPKVSYDIRGTRTIINTKTTPLRRSKYGVTSAVKSVDKLNHHGKVYNLSVSYDESYVVAGRSVHNCSFESSLVGAYYSKELTKAKEEKRIGNFPINPRLPLISFWDIGVSDANAIWIMQPDGNKCYMVGYYENNNEGVEHYIDYLHKFSMKCGAKFMKHFAPHDVKAREWTTNRSRFETARSLGINFIIVKNIAFQDGIQAARQMFAVTYFDEKNCSIGLRFLHEYSRKYSEEKKVFEDKENHNYAAHCGAAFRYYAVAWQDSMQYKHTYQQQQVKDWDPLGSF